MRADARRNRIRILEVALAAFAAEGLGVSVHEIARRAGVGTGTVSRHFPTKDALIQAIIVDRAAHLMERGRALACAPDPAAAFTGFLGLLVQEMAADKGLADALAGAGIDLEATVAGSGYDVTGMLGTLLARAREAGAIRADVSLADVKALMTGCLYDDPAASAAGAASASGASGAPGVPAVPGRTGRDAAAPKSLPDAAAEAARRRAEIVCAGLLTVR